MGQLALDPFNVAAGAAAAGRRRIRTRWTATRAARAPAPAAAIAANLAAAGIGTETDGSIVCPASVDGLVGIKPTVGLVSRSGIIPISHSQDTAGPMARTVADAAIAALGDDRCRRGRSARRPQRGRRADRLHARLDDGRPHGARIGVAAEFVGPRPNAGSPRSMRAIDAQAGSGWRSSTPRSPPRQCGRCRNYEVLLYEFKGGLEAISQRRRADRSLAS